jgi:hypothetical protein
MARLNDGAKSLPLLRTRAGYHRARGLLLRSCTPAGNCSVLPHAHLQPGLSDWLDRLAAVPRTSVPSKVRIALACVEGEASLR